MTASTGARSGYTDQVTDSAAQQASAVTLEIVDGPARGARSVLERGSLIVGREPGCGLEVSEASVSSRHLEVQLLPGAVRVRDLGSLNGTRYLGARIQEATVPVGGEVVIGRSTLRFEGRADSAPVSERTQLGGLLGASVAMRKVFAALERLAASDTTVLVVGETGVGKETAARAIHALSSRRDKPFVAFSCGAASSSLLESDLFGHVRGAFTGAVRPRIGVIASAEAGTLFLDEVAGLALELQPLLLRLLERREYRPVGSDGYSRADVRIIASSSRDLEAEVAAGRFRSDLYYRLAVAVVPLPPLRHRGSDIPLLAKAFARELTGVEVTLRPATLAAFQCDPWPGNVRELRNAVLRSVTLESLDSKASGDLPASPPAFLEARQTLLDQFERDYVTSLLARHGGNISAASREAKISRRWLYQLLQRHGLAERG